MPEKALCMKQYFYRVFFSIFKQIRRNCQSDGQTNGICRGVKGFHNPKDTFYHLGCLPSSDYPYCKATTVIFTGQRALDGKGVNTISLSLMIAGPSFI